MTTPDARATAPPVTVRACDVPTCETTKLHSVPSTYPILLIIAVTALGINAYANAAPAPGRPPIYPMLPTFTGLPSAALAVGPLGILRFGSEHGTGLIGTTFAAISRRRALLAAKVAIVGTVALITSEALAFASFFLVLAILASHHHGISLSDPGGVGEVLAEGALLFACALLGTGLGTIMQRTAGSVAALTEPIVAPAILLFLPNPFLLPGWRSASRVHAPAERRLACGGVTRP